LPLFIITDLEPDFTSPCGPGFSLLRRNGRGT